MQHPTTPSAPGPAGPAVPAEPSLRALAPEVLAGIPRVLALPLLLLTTGVLVVHLRDREQDRSAGRQRGLGRVRLQAQTLERELKWATFAMLGIAEDPAVHQQLSGADRRHDLQRSFERLCRVSRAFDQARLLDADGRELVRVNFASGVGTPVPEPQLQSKANRYYFERAWELRRGSAYISPFDLNVEHGILETPPKPVIRLATPAFDEEGRKRGVIVLNYLGAELLTRLRRAAHPAPGLGLLVNREGFYLEGPTPSESWGFAFGAPPTFSTAHPEAWKHMAGTDSGALLLEQGLYTYRALAPQLSAGEGRESDRVDLGLLALAYLPRAELYVNATTRLWRMLWAGGLLVLILIAVSWRLAYASALRRSNEQLLAQSEARLRRLSARLLETQEAERRYVSRELHDDVGQLATALSIDLARAGRIEDGPSRDELIRRAQEGGERLLEAVRRVASGIRSAELEDLGLEGALRAHFADVEQRTGLRIRAHLALDSLDAPTGVAVQLYRIVQEALSNVLKHSGVRAADVELLAQRGALHLSIADAGAGFEANAPTDGIGLLGMRERAELLGGQLLVETAPGAGTRVVVTLPETARTRPHAKGEPQ